jgi:hypothetical protein
MLALVRHHCPCGRSYVVSLAEDEDLVRHPRWGAGAADALDEVGERLIDGRARGFFCTGCSRLHLRVGPPVVHATAGFDGAEMSYALTLN